MTNVRGGKKLFEKRGSEKKKKKKEKEEEAKRLEGEMWLFSIFFLIFNF